MNVIRLGPEYFPMADKGKPVSDGYIYVGQPDLDPEVLANQKTVSAQQESGAIITLSQPIRTSAGGVPVYNNSPITLLVDGDYSLKILNSSGGQVYYNPNHTYEIDVNTYYVDYTQPDQGANTTGSLLNILTTYGSTNKYTIIFKHNSALANTDYVFLTSLNASAYTNVTFKFENGARLKDSASNPVFTWGGGIEADPNQQIFNWGNGSGRVYFPYSGNALKEVFPNWWKVNATPGTTDMTSALQYAFDSGAPAVTLLAQVYGHTGLLVGYDRGQGLPGSIGMAIRGVKTNDAENTYGTKLKKLSGTSTGFYSYASNLNLENIYFDSNTLAGVGVKLAGISLKVDNIRINNVAGTYPALQLTAVNSSEFNDITFGDNNAFRNMEVLNDVGAGYGVWYSTFQRIRGDQSGSAAYSLSCTGLGYSSFYDCHFPSIQLSDGCNTVMFYNIKGEIEGLNDSTWCQINGTGARNIHFYNTRLANVNPAYNLSGKSYFEFVNTSEIGIHGLKVNDTYSTAFDVIEANNVTRLTARDASVSASPGTPRFRFLDCVTADSTGIVLENCNSIDGGSGDNSVRVTYGYRLSTSNLSTSFVNTSGAMISFENVVGDIDLTNVDSADKVSIINCQGTITDPNYIAGNGLQATVGTWTPELVSTDATFTFGGIGRYARYGNMVVFSGYISASGAASGTLTNPVYIQGLPALATAQPSRGQPVTLSNIQYVNYPAAGHLTANVVAGDDIIEFYFTADDGAAAQVTAADFDSASFKISFSGAYIVQ